MRKKYSYRFEIFISIIKLIINEFKKFGLFKMLITCLLFFIVIILIYLNYKDGLISTSYKLIPFIGIITIIFFGGTISSEIENGSMKYYLTKPILRWKIYLSKLLTIYIFILFVSTYILFVYLILIDKIDKSFIIMYYKYTIPLYLIGSICLFVSSIIKNTSLCIGINIFISVFSTLLSQILFGINFNIIEYSFLPYVDFSIFLDMKAIKLMNSELGINLSLNRGIYIDIIYSFIFYIFGNSIFNNKDIRN